MKPIAIDLGRAFWVIARTDESGQPTVASLGDGGLIPALVSEYQGQLALGQLVEMPGGAPPIRDFYRLFSLGAAACEWLGDQGRKTPDGELEVQLAGDWWTPQALVSELLRATTQSVKEYLSPEERLPIVAAIPPDLDPAVLFSLQGALRDADLTLAVWCPSPVAMVYAVPALISLAHGFVVTAFAERGALTLSIVEVVEGFPHLIASRYTEWPWDVALPAERIPSLVQELLLLGQERQAIEAEDIEWMLVGGEESWVPHLTPLLSAHLDATCVPLERPALVVAMGAALLAEALTGGMVFSSLASQTSASQLTLRGRASPMSSLSAEGGARPATTKVGADGLFALTLHLLPEQHNRLTLRLETPDDGVYTRELMLEHRSWEQGDEKKDPDMTAALSHQSGLLTAPIGVQFGEGADFIAIIPAYTALPVRRQYRLPFLAAQDVLWVVEGATTHEPRPGLLGTLPLARWSSQSGPETMLAVEVVCHQEQLIEVVVRLEGQEEAEVARVLERDQCQRLKPVEVIQNASIIDVDALDDFDDFDLFEEVDAPIADKEKPIEVVVREKEKPVADDPKRPKARGGRRAEESTQPDMEVPAELLEAGDQMASIASLPAESARTLMTRSPAADRGSQRAVQRAPSSSPERGGATWTRKVVESGSLELELEEELEPLEPLGEGDGATRVISMSDLGDLHGIRSGLGPALGTNLVPQARTETHVMAVSMEQLEQIQDAPANNGRHPVASPVEVGPYQYDDQSMEYDATIAPGSGMRPPQIDFDAPLSPSQDVIDLMDESIDIVPVIDEHAEELDAGEVTSASMGRAAPPPASVPTPRERRAAPPREVSATPTPASTKTPTPAPEAAEAPRAKSLEALASAVKEKRSQQRSTRLGVSGRPEAPAEAPIEDDPNLSHQERIRSIAEKARQRVEQRERAESQQNLAPVEDDSSLTGALAKMNRAHQLVAEARLLMDEAREMADGLDDLLEQHAVLELSEEEGPPLDASIRREARKILEMGKRIAEVEQNRLPGSTRGTIMRLVKDLDKQIEESDNPNAARLALQLANRLFETIRRDLRPW